MPKENPPAPIFWVTDLTSATGQKGSIRPVCVSTTIGRHPRLDAKLWLSSCLTPSLSSESVYAAGLSASLLAQEPQECSSDGDSVVLVGDPAHAVFKDVLAKNAAVATHLEDLPYHVFGEFGMTLHCNQALRDVHGLDRANVCAC